MNIVDSSGWLEYFGNGPNASLFQPPLDDAGTLVVPAITIYEVFKIMLRDRGENPARIAAAAMQKALVVETTSRMALQAARLSLEHSLPMADSIILATARLYEATIWTQDAHFKNIPGVKYFAAKK